MKQSTKTLLSTAMILAASALCASQMLAQDAATPHYVITANDIYRAPNSATVFRLSGSSLVSSPALDTSGWGIAGGYYGTNQQTVIKVGTSVCAYVGDPGSDDIAAFNTTSFTSPVKVGNYDDPTGSGAYTGIALAARGSALFAGYSASVNIGVWAINADCSLTLGSSASNTPTPAPVNDLAVTPNGATLIATYGQTNPGVGAFAISGTALTAMGPYNTNGPTAGIDITEDSKFAIIGDYSLDLTQVEIFPIKSDSSLGSEDYYNIAGGGGDSNNVWLSPDETILYVSSNVSLQITTLRYTETNAAGHRLKFACLSPQLKSPAGGSIYNTVGLATAAGTGNGGYLYVAEVGNPSAVALMQISSYGCPVEVSGSPFVNPNSANGFPTTVSAYPPRPF